MREEKKALERVLLLFKKVDGNASEEEARTCAHIAVKLILKHKFEVSLSSRIKPQVDFMAEMEEIFRQAQQRAQRRDKASSSQRPSRPTPHPPDPVPKSKTEGMHYEVHYGSGFSDFEKCAYCGRPLNNGYIVYKAWPGGVHLHKECQPAYEVSNG